MGRRKRRKNRGESRPRVASTEPSLSSDATSPPRWNVGAFALGLFAIFAVALGTRLWHVEALNDAPTAALLLGDAESYYDWALRLVSGDWAGNTVFYQAPLYPYLLGGLFTFFEPSPAVVRYAQALLGSLACVVLALAGRRWFSPSVGIVAGLFLALYAPAIFFVGLLQKTTVALALFVLLLWLVGAAVTTNHRPTLLWGAVGLCLATTALARENALILIIPVLSWIAFDRSFSNRAAVRWRSALAFAAGLACVLAPVAFRNYAVGGDVAWTTSQLGTNLYIGNNADATGTYQPLRAGRDDPRFEAADARALAEAKSGRSLTANEVSSFYVSEVIDYILSEPWDWMQLMGRKVALAGNAAELADTEDLASHAEYSSVLRATSVWNFGVLLPLVAMGVVLTRSRWRELLPLHALALAYGAGLVGFFVFARYRFFVVPLLMLFAAAAVPELVRLLRRPRFATAAVVSIGIVATVLAHQPLVDVDAMRGVTQFNYGLGFERAGNEELARASYERALSFQPNIAEAHYRVGIFQAQDAETDSAIAHFRTAIALSPTYHDVRNSLGVLLLRSGDPVAAEEQFREALGLVPTDAQALNNLANIAFQRRDLVAARTLFRRSVEHDPANAQTHNNLGIIAAIQGEIPLAIGHFEDALAVDPGYEEARLNLARAQSAT